MARQPYIPNLGKIIRFENGDMTEDEITEFFQELIDNGEVSKLRGTYARIANHLISQGICHKVK